MAPLSTPTISDARAAVGGAPWRDTQIGRHSARPIPNASRYRRDPPVERMLEMAPRRYGMRSHNLEAPPPAPAPDLLVLSCRRHDVPRHHWRIVPESRGRARGRRKSTRDR